MRSQVYFNLFIANVPLQTIAGKLIGKFQKILYKTYYRNAFLKCASFLTHLSQCHISIPPENIRKPLVF